MGKDYQALTAPQARSRRILRYSLVGIRVESILGVGFWSTGHFEAWRIVLRARH
jgi:hypothetical protein